ncbi:MAG: thiol-disulfide isomerase [Bryobacteraceae bacterium]
MRFALPCLLALAGSALAANTNGRVPTFAKDVAPIVYSRCTECHRPGEAAPMSFTSYKEVRPWAKAIKEKVVARTMPPWLADPAHGVFKNDRRLTAAQIATISEWANGGAPEGNPKDAPAPPKFETGWTIGKPDQVIDMGTDFAVPSDGVVAYQHFTVDPGFTKDMWVQAAEVRPDKRNVVHHVIVYVLPPNVPVSAAQGEAQERREMLVGFAPGDPATTFEEGTARLVKAGSKLIFQMHYTPTGKPYTDRSYIGLIYAKQTPERRAVITNAGNGTFRIPPGDPNYEVKSSWTASDDIIVTSFMPHMHVRGKDYKYTVTYPDGRSEVVLDVPKYDFNWQLTYELEKPLHLPKGSRIDGVAHYDNSPNNKFNPDPTKEVRFGPQTWEEMMLGWFTYTIPSDHHPLTPQMRGRPSAE